MVCVLLLFDIITYMATVRRTNLSATLACHSFSFLPYVIGTLFAIVYLLFGQQEGRSWFRN